MSGSRRHALSTEGFARLRASLLEDSYAFTKVICKHRDLIPEFHAPISYMFTHSTDQLIRTLNDPAYESYVTQQLRADLRARGVDWNTAEGWSALDALLDTVNIRVYRGSFKSSVGTHAGGLFIATKDPNRTIWLVSNSDPNAWAFCHQIGETFESGAYQDIFPERKPVGNLRELITDSRIRLGGRTISHPQVNIEADGYLTKRISAHFDTFFVDDLIVGGDGGNATPAEIPGAIRWITNMTGFEMATRRTWRRHMGTIWAEDDDHSILKKQRDIVLTLEVPIEVYDGEGYVENILRRGTPTNPKMHDRKKIAVLQAKTLTNEKEGPAAWRCNYLLDATTSGERTFSPRIIDDLERRYTRTDSVKDKGRFYVTRFVRDAEGSILFKCADGCKSKTTAEHISGCERKRIRYNPWTDLDIVMTIDASWVEGGDNWAVHVEGSDSQGYRFELETKSGRNGQEGWLNAAEELNHKFAPRIIGFDGAAYQEKAIQNLMQYDKRLRKLRHKMVKVPDYQKSKLARIKQFVAEPLKMFKILLDPTAKGVPSREEMRAYVPGGKSPGILDTFAMAPAISLMRPDAARLARMKERRKRVEQQYKRLYDPVLGVERVA